MVSDLMLSGWSRYIFLANCLSDCIEQFESFKLCFVTPLINCCHAKIQYFECSLGCLWLELPWTMWKTTYSCYERTWGNLDMQRDWCQKFVEGDYFHKWVDELVSSAMHGNSFQWLNKMCSICCDCILPCLWQIGIFMYNECSSPSFVENFRTSVERISLEWNCTDEFRQETIARMKTKFGVQDWKAEAFDLIHVGAKICLLVLSCIQQSCVECALSQAFGLSTFMMAWELVYVCNIARPVAKLTCLWMSLFVSLVACDGFNPLGLIHIHDGLKALCHCKPCG